jgi:hypothetical protein
VADEHDLAEAGVIDLTDHLLDASDDCCLGEWDR